MNFLKITGLLVGTGSVVGGTGAGVYYSFNSKNNSKEIHKKVNDQENEKTQFDGKLVFEKKTDNNYEIKFLSNDQYTTEVDSFDEDKTDEKKYAVVNKVIEISLKLNILEMTQKLKDILGDSWTFEDIKSKISTKEKELKALFNDEIYTSLKNKF